MGFKETLKELREDYGLTQKVLAENSKLSPQCISQLEMGIRSPNSDTLIALADTFECSIDYLLGRVENEDTIYSQSPKVKSFNQKLIEIIKGKELYKLLDFVSMYSELPLYLQENIFSELKGMHLAYTTHKSTKKQKKEN